MVDKKINVAVSKVVNKRVAKFDDRARNWLSGSGRISLAEGGIYWIPKQLIHVKDIPEFKTTDGRSIKETNAIYMVHLDENGSILEIIEPSFNTLRQRHYGIYNADEPKEVEAIMQGGVARMPRFERSIPANPVTLHASFDDKGQNPLLDNENFVLRVASVTQVNVPTWESIKVNGTAQNSMVVKDDGTIAFDAQTMPLFEAVDNMTLPDIEEVKSLLADSGANVYFE